MHEIRDILDSNDVKSSTWLKGEDDVEYEADVFDSEIAASKIIEYLEKEGVL